MILPVDWYLTGGKSYGIGNVGEPDTENVVVENCFGINKTPISYLKISNKFRLSKNFTYDRIINCVLFFSNTPQAK